MKTKIDILNRDEFINRVIQLVNLISSNKGNMTFAINGAWGCGKTFVLEEIERRLSDDEYKKYLVIHYNCWQYDYYDEPLVALVSVLLDYLKKTKKVSPKKREKVATVAKQLGKAAFIVGAHYIENKTGLDFGKEADAVTNIFDGIDEALKVNDREFDKNLSLKDTLEKLKNELAKVLKEKTLIFCVDELDRCLPEYAIKVLERLHHFTEGLPNTITILAVDKNRLENTVTSIFGKDNATDYLKKFVRFELSLDNGRTNAHKFFEKYPDFYERFDPSLFDPLQHTEQFIEELFRGIDPRSQERIVEKATIFNDVYFGTEKQDYTMMYMELFMATLYYYHHDESIFAPNKGVRKLTEPFGNCDTIAYVFGSPNSGFRFDSASIALGFYGNKMLVSTSNIYMVIYYYWYHATKRTKEMGNQELFPGTDVPNARLEMNLEKISNGISLLKTIS